MSKEDPVLKLLQELLGLEVEPVITGSRVQAMSKLWKYQTAQNDNDFVGMLQALGISHEMAEATPFNDLLDSLSVRLADTIALVEGKELDA